MKQIINSKIYTLTIAILVMICCNNTSVVNTSTETSTNPDVNFYGILEGHDQISPVEAILIGGKYESIPFYPHSDFITHQNKKTDQIDPKQNKTLINLQDIKSIALEHPHNPTTSSIQINNKTYIQIIVESLHGTKKHYLVESSRKITCKEVDKGNSKDTPIFQNRDINFIHIKKLIIKGYKSNHTYQAPHIDISKDQRDMPHKNKEKTALQQSLISNEDKEKFKETTTELLQVIEKNVKNMPLDNPTTFETMRSTVLTLLKSLRDQLQKFLDMIK